MGELKIMPTIYQNSVTAFVDLLGFSEALKIEENAHEILTILHQFKGSEKKTSDAKAEVKQQTTEIKVTPSISAFSDNLLISVSEKIFDDTVSWRHAVIEILNVIQQVANLVIQKGFLIRGGITVGNLHHENGIAFGPAFVEAYQLESKQAKYPRILASNDIVDIFNSDKNGGTQNCFLQDTDGRYYLDYLPTALRYSSQPDTYQAIIQAKINELTNLPAKDEDTQKILDKWIWFAGYHQRSIE
jgi:hypothetical protein